VQPCVAYGCHYGCFLSCMSEELCWLLELELFLPPGACPSLCRFVWVTWKVVYASVSSVVFGFNLGLKYVVPTRVALCCNVCQWDECSLFFLGAVFCFWAVQLVVGCLQPLCTGCSAQ